MAPKSIAERGWFVGFARSLFGRMDLALTVLLQQSPVHREFRAVKFEWTDDLLTVSISGISTSAVKHERLIDLVNRNGNKLPQVCYHPQLGPIQCCDTCMVEVNGKLVRACTTVSTGMEAGTESEAAFAAQREAFNRILSHYVVYCTKWRSPIRNGNFMRYGSTTI
jgi:2Fe-2S iron-sulfur cluster binding domain